MDTGNPPAAAASADPNAAAGVALAKVDQAILALIAERERLADLILLPEIEIADRHNFIAPFALPLGAQADQPVTAFRQFLPGVWVGFEAGSGASVTVRQTEKPDPFVSPPDHHFLFEVTVVDPGTTRWLTVESHAGRIAVAENYTAAAFLKVRANRAATLRFEIGIPRKGKPDARLPLGTANIGTDFQLAQLATPVSRQALAELDPAKSLTIITFLPTSADFRLELAFLRVLLSRTPA